VELADVTDGVPSEHVSCHAAVRFGIILRDRHLDDGPEQTMERLQDAKVCKLPRIAPDWQFVEHPGYIRDRRGIPTCAMTARVEF
jgi:hypothetical protein